MKKTVLCSLVVCVVTLANAKLSDETVNAMTWGARTKVTFRVVDSSGVPVTNALMRFAWSYDYTNKSKELDTKTDENGQIVIEAKSRGTFTWFAEKPNYYKSKGEYSFYMRGETRVKDGRWEPWNPTVEIVLKEKRNPTPLVRISGQFRVPALEEPLGFDCVVGDWVKPHGNGATPDLIFNLSLTNNIGALQGVCQLEVHAVDPEGGIMMMSKPKDGSELQSIYEAPLGGYEGSAVFCWAWVSRTITEAVQLGNDEYMLFKSRIVRDDSGNVVEANYGKIYYLKFGADIPDKPSAGRIEFRCYLNAAPNDRNLEWNGANSATGEKWSHFQP